MHCSLNNKLNFPTKFDSLDFLYSGKLIIVIVKYYHFNVMSETSPINKLF